MDEIIICRHKVECQALLTMIPYHTEPSVYERRECNQEIEIGVNWKAIFSVVMTIASRDFFHFL